MISDAKALALTDLGLQVPKVHPGNELQTTQFGLTLAQRLE